MKLPIQTKAKMQLAARYAMQYRLSGRFPNSDCINLAVDKIEAMETKEFHRAYNKEFPNGIEPTYDKPPPHPRNTGRGRGRPRKEATT